MRHLLEKGGAISGARLLSGDGVARYRAGELVGIRLASNVLRFRESAVEAFLEECSRPVSA